MKKYRQERKKFVEYIKERLTDKSFVQKSRTRFWKRLAIYSISGLSLIFLALLSYPYTAEINRELALAVSILIFFLAVPILSKSRLCGACNGKVNTSPAFCLDCGLTYWMHKSGRKAYKERLRRIESGVAERMAKHKERHKAQYEFLEKAENILKIENLEEQDKQIIELEKNSVNKKRPRHPVG